MLRCSNLQWRKWLRVLETVRELELEVEPEDGIELLQFHDETWTEEGLLLMDEQRKWFLEIEFTPGKDSVKLVEMTTKDLEWCINLVDKKQQNFERIDSNFKCGQNAIKQHCCYRNIVCEKSQLMQQNSSSAYFKKLPEPPHPSATYSRSYSR